MEKPTKDTPTKKLNVLMIDNGLFTDFCLTIAKNFNTSYYFINWSNEYPKMHKAVIGSEWDKGKMLDTFDGVKFIRVENIFDYLDKVDLVFFCDVYDGPLLEMLKQSGIPCWGPGLSERLELERLQTWQRMKKIGMDVPNMQKIIGFKNLRNHLQNVDNKWLKISKYRGEAETFHHENYMLSERWLDHKEHNLGPLKDIIEFLVVDNIDCIVEEGITSWNILGKLPERVITETEVKDEGICATLIETKNLSKGNKKVNQQFEELLREDKSSTFFATEIRSTKDNKNYLIDPCMRLGLPSNDTMQTLVDNLAEVIWKGSHGELVNPKGKYKYALSVLISSGWVGGNHQTLHFPQEYREYIKIVNPVKINGVYHSLKTSDSNTIGSVTCGGSSLEECKTKLIEIGESIEGYEINVKLGSIDKCIEEFNKMMGGNK